MAVLIVTENNVIYRIRDMATIAEVGVCKEKTKKDTISSKHPAKKLGTKYIFSSVLNPCTLGLDRRKIPVRCSILVILVLSFSV